MANKIRLLRLLVDVKNDKPAYEEVRVEDCGDGQYRLLQSPGFVLGIAADDVFTVESDHTYKLVSRGRNICIQIFREEELNSAERVATAALGKLGGRLDGRLPNVLVYTVSVDAGFEEIQRILDDLKIRFPGLDWYYGNVYDPADGVTPLNWWFDA